MRWSILLLSLVLLQTVSAVSTTLAPSYQPGETILIKIEGNILEPILSSDILFKRNHILIPVNYDITRINGTYYLYAQAPINKNNYTLFIKDISTTINGVVKSINFNQSFSVIGNLTDYSVSPGFAIVHKDKLDFTITLNLDNSVNINTNFPEEHSITLSPGQNKISLSTANKSEGIYLITLGKYQIPVQIIRTNSFNNATIINEIPFSVLKIYPSKINRTISSNSIYSFNISLTNNGSSNLQNVQFSFNQSIFSISPSVIASIKSNESKEVTISLLNLLDGKIQEEIIIYDANQQLYNLKLNLFSNNNSNEPSLPTQPPSGIVRYCSEDVNGKSCAANEVCSVELIQMKDGACCTGTCSVKKESSSGWIAYLSIIIIVGILIFVYLRYKKTAIPKIKPGLINPASLSPEHKTNLSSQPVKKNE